MGTCQFLPSIECNSNWPTLYDEYTIATDVVFDGCRMCSPANNQDSYVTEKVCAGSCFTVFRINKPVNPSESTTNYFLSASLRPIRYGIGHLCFAAAIASSDAT